eukprot:6298149-Prymnesium_polylepis.1
MSSTPMQRVLPASLAMNRLICCTTHLRARSRDVRLMCDRCATDVRQDTGGMGMGMGMHGRGHGHAWTWAWTWAWAWAWTWAWTWVVHGHGWHTGG